MDFYCPKVRLGIELEGKIHLRRKIYDTYREKYLQALKIKILKFPNEDISNRLPYVLKIVKSNFPLSLIKERGLRGELEPCFKIKNW